VAIERARPDITPCAQKAKKVPKKTTRYARGTKHYAQLKRNKKNLVGFFGTFLGAGRDMPMTPIDRWALSE
jgi:hypothetical protein